MTDDDRTDDDNADRDHDVVVLFLEFIYSERNTTTEATKHTRNLNKNTKSAFIQINCIKVRILATDFLSICQVARQRPRHVSIHICSTHSMRFCVITMTSIGNNKRVTRIATGTAKSYKL